jgi:cytoplasmic iron level regulating protein YaaA (DUF328/UPF0246 family)
MNFREPLSPENGSLPLFEKEAEALIEQLTHYKTEEIMQKEKLSVRMALSTFEYIQTYSLKSIPRKQSIFAYSGNVYNK